MYWLKTKVIESSMGEYGQTYNLTLESHTTVSSVENIMIPDRIIMGLSELIVII